MKQETLEEAVLKYNDQFIGGQENIYAAEDFINGAKWQQERMYSNKKRNIEPQLIPLKDWINVWKNLKEWFKQFKNK